MELQRLSQGGRIGDAHPGVVEYLLWARHYPRTWDEMGKMPIRIGTVFRRLVLRLGGKDSPTDGGLPRAAQDPAGSGFADLVAREQARVNADFRDR